MVVKKGYKQTEVGVIPEDWDVKTITEVCGFIVPGRNKPRVFNGDIPWVTTPDLKDGGSVFESRSGLCITKAEANAVGSRIVPKGSVLMSCAGELGIVALVRNDMVINQQLHAFLPTASINGQYLRSALKTRIGYIDSIATKTAVPYLNKDNCNSIQIPFPTLREQEAIAGALSDADAWIESLEQLIAKKRQIKQGAMQELLTGKRRLPGFSGQWISRMLPEVSHFRGGKAHEQYIRDNAKYVCVNSKFISTEGKVRKYTTENFCSARADDILMVMSDLPNGKALAKTFIVDKDNLYAVNQRVCALTPRESYCSQFLAFVLDRNAYFLRFDDGVNQTHLLNRVFEKCPLVVPATKAEQTAIASVLSDMDSEIESLESKLAKAREIKQGMMQELLTGKIRLIEN